MSTKEIQKIIDNVAFSMEMEGFDIPEEQRQEWEDALTGKIVFDELLAMYINDAKLVSTTT